MTEISRKVKFVQGRPQITFPESSRAFLRADEIDSVYFHVLGDRVN
ncbi:sensor histidine kinase N-terminal domain-containing protein [Propionivibrio sp.]|nr:sensor histidine kinase N-terminal domain-containing protein [Propionivibrio sp.]